MGTTVLSTVMANTAVLNAILMSRAVIARDIDCSLYGPESLARTGIAEYRPSDNLLISRDLTWIAG